MTYPLLEYKNNFLILDNGGYTFPVRIMSIRGKNRKLQFNHNRPDLKSGVIDLNTRMVTLNP